MMKDFDLVAVEYNNGCKELCYAPRFNVTEGAVVNTEFGTGTVRKTLMCWDEDEVFQILAYCQTLHPILSVVKELDYGADS